ncbi:Monooxygenase asqM [Exophiala dermatitidis]
MAPSIAIMGAGPAGLTLARLLQVADLEVSITVFEKDVSPTARSHQGGTLDLHPESGLAAVKKAGLWDEASKYLRYDAEELFITDKNNTVLTHMKEVEKLSSAAEYARPEIDREDLKEVLLKSVKPELIRWGKTLQSVNEDSTGATLTFPDGSTEGPFDLIVGADGAWSKVRAVLTDVRPRYSGICGFECAISTTSGHYPRISKMVGMGSYFSFSNHKGLTAQRMGNGSLKIGMWVTREESYPGDLLSAYGDDEEKLKSKILENYHGWAPELLQCVRAGMNFRPWPLYELPVGHTWDHKPGFTLIGDAASLMTPWAGEGVNKAMKDALELAESLEQALKSGQEMDEATRKYEANMFPRAKRVQTLTQQNKIAMFSDNGAVNLMVSMVEVVAMEMGKDLNAGWLAWIPFRTLMFCYASCLQVLGIWRRKVGDWLFTSPSS